MGIRPLAALLVLIVACDVGSDVSSTTPLGTGSPTTTVESTPTVGPPTTITSEATAFDIGPLRPRMGHSVVWTGEEITVWGGESGDQGPSFGDGAAYDPVANTWHLIAESPLSPRAFHVAAWTGDEMLIVGGYGQRDAAAYDPSTDSWRSIQNSPVPIGHEGAGSVWTGQELMIWDISSNEIAAYTPSLDTWRPLPSIDLTGDTGVLRWTGDALYAFADNLNAYPSEIALGSARLNQEGGWDSIAAADFSRDDLIIGADATLTAWTGDYFLAWTTSGTEGKTMKLGPSDATWTETDPVPVHPCEGHGEPTQPGPLVTAFDSCDSSIVVLDRDTGSWTSSKVAGYPTARYTIWAGDELINWGGGCCPTVEAWRYLPAK